MKCILVALDGSSCAEHALSYAIRVAKAEQASVELRAFVNPRAIVGRSLSEPLKEEHVAAAMIEARGMIAEAIRKASKAGIRASGRAELGEPAVEIVEHAKALGVGAIVMGTHGRSGFKRLFMGSVAEEVLRSASCPVIVIREKTAIEHVPPSPATIEEDQPICELRLLEVAPDDFERLYGEIATFMDGPGAAVPGILERELLGSADRTRILILVRFCSRRDWIRAQWDHRFSQLSEEIVMNSETLEFDLYSGDRFPPKVLQRKDLEPATA